MDYIKKEIGIVDVTFAPNVVVIHPVNLYGCEIGENCFIGPFVEIQKNVKIGRNCKIQSHAFICELVSIGDNCFISHGVKFVNDKFIKGGPAGGKKELWMETTIGNNVSIGTNATILPVKITDHVVIGAGAVVTRNINKPGVYAGNPARFIKDIELE
jgi:acetyltransferase-like isoleucine patch superfamily enzyme